jgi:hypothetical protein
MRTLYTFMTIALLLSSYSMSPIVAGEMPVLVKKKPERMIEKFSELKNSKNRMVGNKNTYVVKDQMLHYFNGEGYDTASTFHYEYAMSVLISEILTKDYIDGIFENSQLETHFRDEMGRDTTVLQQFWDDGKKGWANNWKEVMFFDSHDNEIFNGFYAWNLGQWVLDWGSEMVYEYDANGDILSIEYSYYSWNNWNPSWKELMEYDNNGLLLTWTEQEWSGGSWVNNYHEEYQYVNNVWSAVFGYYWDEWDEEWIPEMWVKDIEWVNFNAFLWASYTVMIHNGIDWVDDERASAAYNSMDMPLHFLFEIWSGISWLNDWQTTWEYDSFFNISLSTDEEWSGGAWILISGYSFAYEYDANNNIAVEYLEIFYDVGKGWEKVHKLESWYENVAGIPTGEVKPFSVHVYPNPAGSYLNIQVDEFNMKSPLYYHLLDLSGRTIMTGQLDSNHSAGAQLNIQDISGGVYLLRVESGNHVENIKIIKQ